MCTVLGTVPDTQWALYEVAGVAVIVTALVRPLAQLFPVPSSLLFHPMR